MTRHRAPLQGMALRAFLRGIHALNHVPVLRRVVFAALERGMRQSAAEHPDPRQPAAVGGDKLAIRLAFLRLAERAVTEDRLSEAALSGFVGNLLHDAMLGHGDQEAKARFRARHACGPPDFLVLSPGKGCNLRCAGCYAASGPAREKLEWVTLDRIVRDARELWGARFFVLSGGEPLLYRDQGRGVLDLAESHPDCFFVMYTNGTLITEEVARRMGETGNLSPALSVEGLRATTDACRGRGVFDRVLAAMDRLQRNKVLYGLSLTATRDNAAEVLSDELIDTLCVDKGALYAFVFHYMPIGRSASLDLMPTPEQRLELWARVWQVVRERRLLVMDFWNSGTASNGCIAAGRPGGYFHVNWDGAASPCVFIPFATRNVREVFAAGGNLDDVWADPFFAAIRAWQRSYGYRQPGERYEGGGNWIIPCLIRDHHADFCRLAERFCPVGTDQDARASQHDRAYHEGLVRFGERVTELADPVWSSRYSPTTPEVKTH